MREREKGTERDKHTDKQTYIKAERDTYRDKQTEIEAEKTKDRQTGRQR